MPALSVVGFAVVGFGVGFEAPETKWEFGSAFQQATEPEPRLRGSLQKHAGDMSQRQCTADIT